MHGSPTRCFSQVRYHLRVGESNVQDTGEFQLDPVSGQLSAKVVLDRELQHKYEVRRRPDLWDYKSCGLHEQK